MKHIILTMALGAALYAAAFPGAADPAKSDAGVLRRTNHLIGYGVVVGLPGTGDTFANCPQLTANLKSIFQRQGQPADIDPAVFQGTMAAVIVTAEMPYDSKGQAIEATVSSMCDGKSLQGGALSMTSLYGADARVYAIAQGVLAPCADAQNADHVPNRGCIADGAIIVRGAQ